MRLHFDKFDGRARRYVQVIDQDTGESVGHINSRGVGADRFGGIEVWLFDGNYTANLNRYDECVGFVLGVQAVLNHILPAKKAPAQTKKQLTDEPLQLRL
jgi:hypothetical protein